MSSVDTVSCLVLLFPVWQYCPCVHINIQSCRLKSRQQDILPWFPSIRFVITLKTFHVKKKKTVTVHVQVSSYGKTGHWALLCFLLWQQSASAREGRRFRNVFPVVCLAFCLLHHCVALLRRERRPRQDAVSTAWPLVKMKIARPNGACLRVCVYTSVARLLALWGVSTQPLILWFIPN